MSFSLLARQRTRGFSATVGWSQDVCKGARFPVEDEEGSASSAAKCAPRFPPRGKLREMMVGNDGRPTMIENNYFTEMCSGSEAGSYVRLIDFGITQL